MFFAVSTYPSVVFLLCHGGHSLIHAVQRSLQRLNMLLLRVIKALFRTREKMPSSGGWYSTMIESCRGNPLKNMTGAIPPSILDRS